jgi:hypothetical protein
MGNFLRRNRFVLRRITTTGRDLPENAIENILAFIADMEKTFGDQIDIDFDSIVNMDETFVYIDMPSSWWRCWWQRKPWSGSNEAKKII